MKKMGILILSMSSSIMLFAMNENNSHRHHHHTTSGTAVVPHHTHHHPDYKTTTPTPLSHTIDVAGTDTGTSSPSIVPTIGKTALAALRHDSDELKDDIRDLVEAALNMYCGPDHKTLHMRATPHLAKQIEQLQASADEQHQETLKHLKQMSSERKQRSNAASSSSSEPIAQLQFQPCMSEAVRAMVMKAIEAEMNNLDKQLSEKSIEAAKARKACEESSRQKIILAAIGAVTTIVGTAGGVLTTYFTHTKNC